MNLKTTLVLLVLVAAGGAVAWFGFAPPAWLVSTAPAPAVAGNSLDILENELTPDKLTAIQVVRGGRRLLLERAPGGEWSLPGKWPTRQAEVEQLVSLLTSLRSRFAPIPLGDDNLARFGLDRPAVVVTVKLSDKQHRLAFAEKEEEALLGTARGAANRFSRPTFLRIDDNREVVRLDPGIVAALDKPVDYYRQHRLFPGERIAKDSGSSEKVEQLSAQALAVEGKKNGTPVSYALTKSGEAWELTRPVRDRVDPDKIRPVLTAVPDIWVEQFVDRKDRPLSEFGLEPPEDTITVTRPGGELLTLLVGKKSPTVRERKVTRPSPPGAPIPPITDTVKEEFRYAKLRDNDQIFEVKADKVKDLMVEAKELRDARLARFRSDDARRLELKYAGQEIVLAKEKDRWQVEKPLKADAETSKVNDILDKLSFLEARDADIIDNADAKTYGFDDPAKVGTLRVTLEEEKGEGDKKTKMTRIIVFQLGKHDADKKKLHVRVEGWERVNAVEDSLVNLAKRPALAYRGRRVLDFATSDLERIEVVRGSETLALKQAKEGWKLEAPVAADADSIKASSLASTLSGLEATEYVNDTPQPKDLEEYGLVKDVLKATLTFTTDSKKPKQTLLIGKGRPGKSDEFFAKLESAPAVFAVKKDVRESLDQGSLVYRPLQLWQVLSDDITALRVQKAGQEEYRLTKKETTWQIAGPFEAAAQTSLVEPMLTELAGPKAERYEVHEAKDPKTYGLDTPHLRVVLSTKDAGKERTLLVGKPTEKDPRQRYAKLGDAGGVFVVGEKLVSALDKGALDLLNPQLLTLDAKTIERVQSKTAGATVTLQRKGEVWEVVESPAGVPFIADRQTADGVVRAVAELQALRFAAYGPKADLASYGLDKPEATVTLTVQPPAGPDGKKLEPKTHIIALGKVVEGSTGERFARIDSGPGVAVLPTFAASELTRSHLDFVDHTLLKFDAGKLTGIVRRAGPETLEVVSRDDAWQIVKPAEQKADDRTLQDLASRLSSLRAERVAAYPAKDLKPFGLDAPAAVISLKLSGGQPAERVLKIGKPVEEKTPAARPIDRYVQVEGSQVVAVLAGATADQLLAGPLFFRDRAIARFDDADRVLLERGSRKATFAKVDGTWKLTEPAEAEAEQVELDDFLNAVARLRADELVAEKPADLKPYGLDKPEVRWRFQSGNKDVLHLLVGGRDKSGTRAYAKLASGDVVFLLDAKLTGRVLAEYRKRSVWATPPDAAQVDRVHYTWARGPFVLEKVDSQWQVIGKPEVKVSTAAGNDALAAIAGLRLERYVLDKGADLKLYGLEPPELVLEVQTPSGKRTLHIGRPEGESKRYYARVPEKDRSDVFVISEADAARMVRDLAGFTEKSEKPKP